MSSAWSPRSGRSRRPQDRVNLPGHAAGHGIAQAVAVRLQYVGLLIVLLWATAYLVTYPEFSVSGTRVQGNTNVPSDTILRAANVSGRNVFLVGTGGIIEAVQQVAPMRDIDVVWSWPSQVTLEVVEFVPAYTWQTRDISYLLSDTGVTLALAGETATPILIVDLDARPIAIGERIDRDPLTTASYLKRVLPALGLAPASFERSDRLGTVAVLPSAQRLAFGASDALPEKLASLRATMATPAYREANPTFVDLRVKDRPYWR